MADEPSNAELGWRLNTIIVRLDNLVGTREYGEFQRHVSHVLAELAKAITEEREAREEALKELRTEQAAGRQTSRMAILTGVGTLLGGICLAVFTTWAHLGGH